MSPSSNSDKDIDIARSDLLVTGQPPQLADRYAADIVDG